MVPKGGVLSSCIDSQVLNDPNAEKVVLLVVLHVRQIPEKAKKVYTARRCRFVPLFKNRQRNRKIVHEKQTPTLVTMSSSPYSTPPEEGGQEEGQLPEVECRRCSPRTIPTTSFHPFFPTQPSSLPRRYQSPDTWLAKADPHDKINEVLTS